jgi:hypothetical protein
MKESYKGYEVEITSRENSGWWIAWAKFRHNRDSLGLSHRGKGKGFKTRSSAIAHTLTYAKDWIDSHT